MAERILMYDPAKPHLGGNIKDGDEMTYFPELWERLLSDFMPTGPTIKPYSICDIGCGEGHLIKYFHDKYRIDVTGIDGLPENKANADPSIRGKIIIHDYTSGWGPLVPVDMNISCEFVEHVEEQYAGNYLLQFCNCNVLVMTHALPRQPGHHHVNCKPDSYWIALMNAFGFELSVLTCQYRKLAHDRGKVLWETILIFEKNGR